MTAAIVITSVLSCIAAMLAVVMLIAWHSFGRPRHAQMWALAFAAATLQWLFNLLLRLDSPDNAWLYTATAGFGCLSNALIAVGFVQRNRAPQRVMPLLVAAALASLMIAAFNFFQPVLGIRYATGLGFGGLMMLISAFNVAADPRRATIPERAVITVLMLFALTAFAMAGMGFVQGNGADSERLSAFRGMLTLLYPVAFIGVGLFSVFLVAADLAENMRMLATSDVLTGVYNRRGFEDAAERAIRNAQRQCSATITVSGRRQF